MENNHLQNYSMQKDKGLLSRYASGERDFSREDFSNIEIYGRHTKKIDLSEADFRNANFEGAIVVFVILNNTNFTNTNCRNIKVHCEITNADFSGADLTNALIEAKRIKETKFINCNFTNAKIHSMLSRNGTLDLSFANCTNTKFSGFLNKINFQHADLKTTKFEHGYLDGSNLKFLDLRNQNFAKISLVRADLSNSNLAEINLYGANLREANLREANLKQANLTHTNFKKTSFTRSNLKDATFANANLQDTIFEDVTGLSLKINLAWQIINQGAKNKNLTNADLSEIALSDVDFTGMDLTGTNFSYSNLKRANFENTNLSQANLNEAILDDCNFKNANLSKANINNSDLFRANLENANLKKSQLNGSNLSSADISFANLVNSSLLGVDLTRANLKRVGLTNANLTNANLSNTNFTQANLSNTNLTRANLFRVNFTDAINAPHTISIFDNSGDNLILELIQKINKSFSPFISINQLSCPCTIFFWETLKWGDFNREGLLKAFGYFSEVDTDIVIRGDSEQLKLLYPGTSYYGANGILKVVQLFRHIFAEIESYVNDIRIFKADDRFYISFTNVMSGDVFGLSTRPSYAREQQSNLQQLLGLKGSIINKTQNKKIIKAIENNIAEVKFSLEDREKFVWTIAKTRSDLIDKLLKSTNLVNNIEITTACHIKLQQKNEEEVKYKETINLVLS
ncbi:MAG: pentapeptide repeat-containing protein, partial [Cyanobacteria bacterium P01_A01_bin.40]